MHFSFLVSSKTEAFQVQPEVCFVQNGVCRHVLYRTVSVAMCLCESVPCFCNIRFIHQLIKC